MRLTAPVDYVVTKSKSNPSSSSADDSNASPSVSVLLNDQDHHGRHVQHDNLDLTAQAPVIVDAEAVFGATSKKDAARSGCGSGGRRSKPPSPERNFTIDKDNNDKDIIVVHSRDDYDYDSDYDCDGQQQPQKLYKIQRQPGAVGVDAPGPVLKTSTATDAEDVTGTGCGGYGLFFGITGNDEPVAGAGGCFGCGGAGNDVLVEEDDPILLAIKANSSNIQKTCYPRYGANDEKLPTTDELLAKSLLPISKATKREVAYQYLTTKSLSPIDFAAQYLTSIHLLTKWSTSASRLPDKFLASHETLMSAIPGNNSNYSSGANNMLDWLFPEGVAKSYFEQQRMVTDVQGDYDPNLKRYHEKFGVHHYHEKSHQNGDGQKNDSQNKKYFEGKYLTDHDGASFLKDIQMCDGVRILISFLKTYEKDSAAIVCAVRALWSCLVDLQTKTETEEAEVQDMLKNSNNIAESGDDSDNDSNTDNMSPANIFSGITNAAAAAAGEVTGSAFATSIKTPMSDLKTVKSLLVQDFIRHGGVSVLLSAWKHHDRVVSVIAVDSKNDSSASASFSIDELRSKTVDILQASLSTGLLSSYYASSTIKTKDAANIVTTLQDLMDHLMIVRRSSRSSTSRHHDNDGGNDEGFFSSLFGSNINLKSRKETEHTNKLLLISSMHCCCLALVKTQNPKIGRYLSQEQVLDLVDIATTACRGYANKDAVRTRSKLIWKWAAMAKY
mmetsp:Transcript_10764/g.25653  ORF Transcript_10764/g.25653 Transcript_10764/m.25653 type:complete len:725 (+) Transcript_10764:201-2375(+)